MLNNSGAPLDSRKGLHQRGLSPDYERCIISMGKKRQLCKYGLRGKNFTLLKKIDKKKKIFRYTCLVSSTQKSRRTGNLQMTGSINQSNAIISLIGMAWEDAKLPRGF